MIKTDILNKNINKYAFIGAGNMAKAIIAGMLQQSKCKHKSTEPLEIQANQIIASNKTLASAQDITKQFGIITTTDNVDCLSADVIILAVKPQILPEVLTELLANSDSKLFTNKLIISVIAGIPCQFYEQKIASNIALVRVMPNTPSLIGKGISGLFANANVTEAQKQLAQEIMTTVGKVVWLQNEEQINYVTAISGSGPAYFYEFTYQLAKAGMKLGFDEATAILLAKETIKGTGLMLNNVAQLSDIEQLRNNVTSKGGTTFAALCSFSENSLDEIVDKAVNACYRRAVELGAATASTQTKEEIV